MATGGGGVVEEVGPRGRAVAMVGPPHQLALRHHVARQQNDLAQAGRHRITEVLHIARVQARNADAPRIEYVHAVIIA